MTTHTSFIHTPNPSGFIALLTAKLLPSRFKRMCVLLSLATLITSRSEFDKETANKLNELLSLCEGSAAAQAPDSIKTVILEQQGSELQAVVQSPELQTEKISDMAQAIVERLPTHLLYSNTAVVRKDVQRLLEHRDELQAA